MGNFWDLHEALGKTLNEGRGEIGSKPFYFLVAPAKDGKSWEVAYSEFQELSVGAQVLADGFLTAEAAKAWAEQHKGPNEEVVVRDTTLFKGAGAIAKGFRGASESFSRGDRVEVNGNKEGIVQDPANVPGMYNVRLWSGSRHVGDVCVSAKEIKLIKKAGVSEAKETCSLCKGTGKHQGKQCTECLGRGTVKVEPKSGLQVEESYSRGDKVWIRHDGKISDGTVVALQGDKVRVQWGTGTVGEFPVENVHSAKDADFDSFGWGGKLSESKDIQMGDTVKVKEDPREGIVTMVGEDGQIQVTYQNAEVVLVSASDVSVKDKAENPNDKEAKPLEVEKEPKHEVVGTDGCAASADEAVVRDPAWKSGQSEPKEIPSEAFLRGSADYESGVGADGNPYFDMSRPEESQEEEDWNSGYQSARQSREIPTAADMGEKSQQYRQNHQYANPMMEMILGIEDAPIVEKKSAPSFKVGDSVRLKADALKHHSQSVPAHAGYSHEQFEWRKTLSELAGKVGKIERVFPSGSVNVQFDNIMIGIEGEELEPVASAKESVDETLTGEDVVFSKDAVEMAIQIGKNFAGKESKPDVVAGNLGSQSIGGGAGFDSLPGSKKLYHILSALQIWLWFGTTQPDNPNVVSRKELFAGLKAPSEAMTAWFKNLNDARQITIAKKAGKALGIQLEESFTLEVLERFKAEQLKAIREGVAVAESVTVPFEIVAWDTSKLVKGVVPMHYAKTFRDKYKLESYGARFGEGWKWNKVDDTLMGEIIFPDKYKAIKFYDDNQMMHVSALPIEKEAVEAVRFTWGALEAEANSDMPEVSQYNLDAPASGPGSKAGVTIGGAAVGKGSMREKWSEMYQKGYDNAAVRFAYIPDFKNADEKKEFERGMKDGYAKISKKGSSNSGSTRESLVEGKQSEWGVYLNGRKVTSVFYDKGMTAEEVKQGLVDHDGYPSNIVVKNFGSPLGKLSDMPEAVESAFMLQESAGIFTAETAQSEIEKIKSGIKAPVVSASLSTLGGNERPSIMILVALQPKDKWPNGYVENTDYARFHLQFTGTLVKFSGSRFKTTFRKAHVDSVEGAINKINRYIQAEMGVSQDPEVKRKKPVAGAEGSAAAATGGRFSKFLQTIMDEGQAESWNFPGGGSTMIDASSAGALLAVYNGLTKDELKAKFEDKAKTKEGLSQLLDFAWKHVKFGKNESRELSVPDRHQLKIAKDTLRMPDAMADVAGGPNKAEAREILKTKFGYSDAQIAKLEESASSAMGLPHSTTEENTPMPAPMDEEDPDMLIGDSEEIEPDTDNDVFYQSYGPLGSNGGFFYGGKEIAKTEDELKAWMEKQGYWPSVWNVSDHGNVSPYTMDEAVLTTAARKRIAPSNFAFPKDRRYPIHDLSHAKNALARVAQSGTDQEKAIVRRKVHQKYASLGAASETRTQVEYTVTEGELCAECVNKLIVFVEKKGITADAVKEGLQAALQVPYAWIELPEGASIRFDPNAGILELRGVFEDYGSPIGTEGEGGDKTVPAEDSGRDGTAMARAIADEYAKNEQGVITSPGKFEGEMYYVPYFWDLANQGFADLDAGAVVAFKLSEEDWAKYPELKGMTSITMEEEGNGFVRAKVENVPWDEVEADFNEYMSDNEEMEEACIREVLGYNMSNSDRLVIKAFLKGEDNRDYYPSQGKNLFLDEDGKVLRSSWEDNLATRTGNNTIKMGAASGNVSQTWINAIRKMAKAEGVVVEGVTERIPADDFQDGWMDSEGGSEPKRRDNPWYMVGYNSKKTGELGGTPGKKSSRFIGKADRSRRGRAEAGEKGSYEPDKAYAAKKAAEGKLPKDQTNDQLEDKMAAMLEASLDPGVVVRVRDNRSNQEIHPELVGKTGQIVQSHHEKWGLYLDVQLEGEESPSHFDWRDVEVVETRIPEAMTPEDKEYFQLRDKWEALKLSGKSKTPEGDALFKQLQDAAKKMTANLKVVAPRANEAEDKAGTVELIGLVRDGYLIGAETDPSAAEFSYWELAQEVEPGDEIFSATIPAAEAEKFRQHGTSGQVYGDGYEAFDALQKMTQDYEVIDTFEGTTTMENFFAVADRLLKINESGSKKSKKSGPKRTCPKCGKEVWDVAGPDQALNKCWDCGHRWMNDPDEGSSSEVSESVITEFKQGDQVRVQDEKAVTDLVSPIGFVREQIGPDAFAVELSTKLGKKVIRVFASSQLAGVA